MILTIIDPSGERWSVDPVPQSTIGLQAWAERTFGQRAEQVRQALLPLRGRMVPKGKALLSHKSNGWQAIVRNP